MKGDGIMGENKINTNGINKIKPTSYDNLKKLCKDNNISTENISTAQMAKLLNVTPATIITYTKEGKIKTVKTPGGRRRIPVKVAEDFIRNHYNIKQPQDIITIDNENKTPINNKTTVDKKTEIKPSIQSSKSKKQNTPQIKKPVAPNNKLFTTKVKAKTIKKDQKKK